MKPEQLGKIRTLAQVLEFCRPAQAKDRWRRQASTAATLQQAVLPKPS
jgi:hypothetical protein